MTHSAKVALIVISVIVVLIGTGCMVFFLGAPKHDNVIMIGHRGYSSKNPDNTDVSFIRAAEHGSKGVETDVRITKDGIFVLSHDSEAKFADGTTLKIADATYAELTAKPLLNKKSDDTVYLCTLQRYLEICKEYNMICFIELKGGYTDQQVEDVYKFFDKYYNVEKCIMQSFEFNNLIKAKEMCARVFPGRNVRFMLTWGKDRGDYHKCIEYGFDIDAEFGSLTQKMVEEFHENGLQVACWTCNEAISLHWAYWHKVDYVESDVF